MLLARYSVFWLSFISRSDVPAMRISPLSNSSSPDRQFSRVVLPQPLGPMIATISPQVTAKLTVRSASTCCAPVVYVLRTPMASIISSSTLPSPSPTRPGRAG